MNALRLAGAVGFVLCGWCAGDAARRHTQEHLEALEAVRALLEELEQEITFRRADLNALARRWAAEQRLQTGQGTLQSALPPPCLTRQEAACFRECFAGLGRAEAEQECQRLALYRERFAGYWHQSQQTAQEQMTLARRLGLAAGLAVGILFL